MGNQWTVGLYPGVLGDYSAMNAPPSHASTGVCPHPGAGRGIQYVPTEAEEAGTVAATHISVQTIEGKIVYRCLDCGEEL